MRCSLEMSKGVQLRVNVSEKGAKVSKRDYLAPFALSEYFVVILCRKALAGSLA